MNFLAITSSCSDPALGAFLAIVKNILSVIQIIGPIVCIVSLTYHIIMLVKSPDDKKAFPKIKNSLLALAVLFLIPFIVNAVMGLLDDSTTLSDCWNNTTTIVGNGGTYIDPNSGSNKKKPIYENSSDYESGVPSESSTDGNNGNSSNSTSTSNNGSSSTSTQNNSTQASRVVFIGDSRTVQMYAYLNNNWNGANYSSGGVHDVGSDVYVAEGSMGLNWMKSTGIPAAEKYFTKGSAIVILMGVNDLYNADNYVKYINENASNWKKNGSSLYFVSANPCTGNYAYLNSDIKAFNTKVKSGLSSEVGWIDTSSQLNSNNISSTDGLHYGKATYQIIYNYIKSHV